MSGVGLNVPKLVPITGTWAVPFTLYYLLLPWRVVSKSKVYLGDKIPSPQTQATSPSTSSELKYDALEIASRCHGNFLENVPLAFIFLSIAELNGGNPEVLNYVMAVLFAFRVAHADGGLRLQGKWGGGGIGRPLGYFGTNGVLLGLSGYDAWLVKGYWGF